MSLVIPFLIDECTYNWIVAVLELMRGSSFTGPIVVP
jgi:hypothetical protein